jgi:hypothetical protein
MNRRTPEATMETVHAAARAWKKNLRFAEAEKFSMAFAL